MLKTISALALATASMTAPAFAEDVKAPVAPVVELGSDGLRGAYVFGGVAVVGIAAVAILAGSDDDDDSAGSTGSTNGT